MIKVKIQHLGSSISDEIFEGTVTFVLNGKEYNAFSIEDSYTEGEEANVEIYGLSEGSLEETLQGNPLKKKELVPKGDCSYDAFGEIVSVDPIVADFGNGIELEIGNWSKDTSLIGKYIFVYIARLDILRVDR